MYVYFLKFIKKIFIIFTLLKIARESSVTLIYFVNNDRKVSLPTHKFKVRNIAKSSIFFVSIQKLLINLVFRKRTREQETGDGEFFPLSKRITQLRINSEYQPLLLNNHQVLLNNQILPKITTTKHENQTIAQQEECYAPELSLQENPHYFRSNKVLFDAFQQRKTRENDNTRIIL